MVTYELRRLLEIPAVMNLVSESRLAKFQSYFKHTLEILISDEQKQSSIDSSKKKLKFSSCFLELAHLLKLDVKADDDES